MGELDSEDGALRANDIRDVRNGCTRGSTKVQHFGARSHVDVVDTTQNASCQLTPERIPHAVFDGTGGRVLSNFCGIG